MGNCHYIIEGGQKLHGELFIHGSKNSVLPILIGATLCKGTTEIRNCPFLSDVNFVLEILKNFGCKVEKNGENVCINPENMHQNNEPEKLMQKMRASILFLSVLIKKFNYAKMYSPGGCSIGLRPIDLHIQGLSKMGVDFVYDGGTLNAKCEKKLKGAKINLGFPSVGATENLIIAAVLAEGETVIKNAAREPEIVDLANFFIKCGAKIRGAGESEIYIDGVKSLCACSYKIIPDRIVASTFMGCIASAGGDLCLRGIEEKHLKSIIPLFKESGCQIGVYSKDLIIRKSGRLNSLKLIKTEPYPGFPTDSQAIFMSSMAIAKGDTVFIETIFENRFHHANELIKMGSNILTENNLAVVSGVKKLHGAKIKAEDLRGGVALMISALAAEGKTVLSGAEYIERGYDNIENQLTLIGAKIEKIQNYQ